MGNNVPIVSCILLLECSMNPSVSVNAVKGGLEKMATQRNVTGNPSSGTS